MMNKKFGKAFHQSNPNNISAHERLSFDPFLPRMKNIDQPGDVVALDFDAIKQQLYVQFEDSEDITIFHSVTKSEYQRIIGGGKYQLPNK